MLDTKLKNNHKLGIILIVLTILIPAIAIVALYPVAKSQANRYQETHRDDYEVTTSVEEYVGYDYIDRLYNSSYVLYLDLQKKQGNADTAVDLFVPNLTDYYGSSTEEYSSVRSRINEMLEEYRSSLVGLMDTVDYYAVDKLSQNTETNTVNDLSQLLTGSTADVEKIKELYDCYLILDFDENGDISVIGGYEIDWESAYREIQENRHENTYTNHYGDSGSGIELASPKNMQIVYAIKIPMMTEADNGNQWWYQYSIYNNIGYSWLMIIVLAIIGAVAILLPRMKKLGVGNEKIFRAPMEFGIIGICIVLNAYAGLISMMIDVNLGYAQSALLDAGFTYGLSEGIPYAYNILGWAAAFALWYWSVTILQPVFTLGLRRYIKERSFIYKIFPFIKRQTKRFFAFVADVDLTEHMNKTIWKIVLINFVVVTIICCMWFFGIFGVIVYSVILFVSLRKYFSRLREQYKTLLQTTNQLAEGNLDIEINEDLGVFNPFKGELQKIQSGFKKAVEEEVKSQNMKTELITNVSHDLKTPLTAIITYVDLLKDENITAEERQSYINTLDKKSQRLKVLIEDLFEVSKATTKNVTLNIIEVDIVNLLKQVKFELEEKIQTSTLDFRWNLPDEKVILGLDSQKTYRVFENLINNILKYSMPNSRVYIDVTKAGEHVQITMKNVSATELNFDPEEITERFVRGDLSRNTEGSGLGLAIAKSFVELQNGSFTIDIDGDLFKVTLTW